jgi:hypothetical protein
LFDEALTAHTASAAIHKKQAANIGRPAPLML